MELHSASSQQYREQERSHIEVGPPCQSISGIPSPKTGKIFNKMLQGILILFIAVTFL